MDFEKVLREHLLNLLDGKGAHVTLEQAIEGLLPAMQGRKVETQPYTIWQVLEHMRIAQWDILEFSRNPEHASPEWPAGYWPESRVPSDDDWERSLKSFLLDLEAMKGLVKNPSTDLLAPIPHGDGQTILREVLLVSDHNAYHLGQVVLLRKLLGNWPV